MFGSRTITRWVFIDTSRLGVWFPLSHTGIRTALSVCLFWGNLWLEKEEEGPRIASPPSRMVGGWVFACFFFNVQRPKGALVHFAWELHRNSLIFGRNKRPFRANQRGLQQVVSCFGSLLGKNTCDEDCDFKGMVDTFSTAHVYFRDHKAWGVGTTSIMFNSLPEVLDSTLFWKATNRGKQTVWKWFLL